jgi:hypothetical protein
MLAIRSGSDTALQPLGGDYFDKRRNSPAPNAAPSPNSKA